VQKRSAGTLTCFFYPPADRWGSPSRSLLFSAPQERHDSVRIEHKTPLSHAIECIGRDAPPPLQVAVLGVLQSLFAADPSRIEALLAMDIAEPFCVEVLRAALALDRLDAVQPAIDVIAAMCMTGSGAPRPAAVMTAYAASVRE
jgi:hypothetical protein